MFRLTRPLFQAARKTTTGLTGLSVHPDPLPALQRTYEQTLTALAAMPAASVYRQGTEALTRRKLDVVQRAAGDVAAVERTLDEGQIEEVLGVAEDELKLAGKMAEWKPCVYLHYGTRSMLIRLRYAGGNLWRRSPSPGSGSTLARRHSASTLSSRNELVVLVSVIRTDIPPSANALTQIRCSGFALCIHNLCILHSSLELSSSSE
jgi:NADH dehydrogenase (ubiquinone) 1 alpha subcomplex subunit 5